MFKKEGRFFGSMGVILLALLVVFCMVIQDGIDKNAVSNYSLVLAMLVCGLFAGVVLWIWGNACGTGEEINYLESGKIYTVLAAAKNSGDFYLWLQKEGQDKFYFYKLPVNKLTDKNGEEILRFSRGNRLTVSFDKEQQTYRIFFI